MAATLTSCFRYSAAGLCGLLVGWLARTPEAASPVLPAAPHPAAGSVKSPVGQDAPAKPGDTGKASLAQAVARAAALELPAASDPTFGDIMRGILREPDKQKRLAELQALMEKMNPAQLAAIVPLIRECDLQGTSNGDEWSLLFNQWGRTDGKHAIAFVQSHDWTGWDPRAPAEAQSRAMSGWAASNITEALAFLENPAGPVNEEGRSLQYSLLRGWATVDPAAAGKWLMSRPGVSRGDDNEVVLEGLSRQVGPQAIESWFAAATSTNSNPASAGNFAAAISEVKAKYDPEGAAKWLETHTKAEWANSTGAFFLTAGSLAAKDPVAAMEWAGRTGLGSAAAGAMQQWCELDMTAASVWLRDHSAHPGYNTAAEVLTTYLMKDDPEAARLWAGSIVDAESRSRILEQIEAISAAGPASSGR